MVHRQFSKKRKLYTIWNKIPLPKRNKIIADYRAKKISEVQAYERLNVSKATFHRHLKGGRKTNFGVPSHTAHSQVAVSALAPKNVLSMESVFGCSIFLNSKLNRKLIFVEQPCGGFLEYNENYTSQNGVTTYRCTSPSTASQTGCEAVIFMTINQKIVGAKHPKHSCGCAILSTEEIIVREVERKARLRVADQIQPPKTSWEQGHLECIDIVSKFNLPWDGRAALQVMYPSWNEVENQFHRVRNQRIQSKIGPDIYKEIESSAYAYTYLSNCSFGNGGKISEKWLLSQSKTLGVLVFASNNDLEHFASASILQSDATFKTTPQKFRQVFTIHAEVKGEWAVVATALMEKKSNEAYEFVFSSLIAGCKSLGLCPDPSLFLTDFESAERGAVTKIFPNARMKGFLF